MAKNINVAYDWLNMFTKVSERLYLAFFVKMGKTRAQQDRSNELRRIKKSKSRQASFISEYIQMKYFAIYGEAAKFFNELNTLYATKYDLRKTKEFRDWKTSIIRGELPAKRPRREYLNINTGAEFQSAQSIQFDQESPESYQFQSPESHQSQSPESHQSQSPESYQSQSPESHQSQSPESHQSQSPESHQSQSPESHQSQSPESHQSQSPESHQWKDNMELRIPLMEYKTPQPKVTTKTLEIVTEETIGQSDIQYEAVNDLTDATIDEIIKQLRQDSELNDIFNDIDTGFDTELYDIRLENELLTW